MKGLFLPSRHGKRSSALVFTLLAVVLVTLAVLVFFSSVTTNRQIESSRVHGTQADQMVRTAGDYVTAQFLQEITSAANSTSYMSSGTLIYTPKANTNAVPARIVTATASTSANFFSLIRQSIPAADSNASSDSTSVAAGNGRSIGFDRWNAPMLVLGAGFNLTSQLSNWIYVDRLLGATASKATPANIIGRFAYNVYDIGGLLNANGAGYPNAVAANATVLAQLKSTLAGADLTQIPNVAQTPDVDNLIAFRNPGASTDPNKYLSMAQASVTAGFLNPTVAVTNSDASVTYYTNNFFNGRQDLLRYVRTQNANLTNAAPYLTTFSRSLNAPSWGPQTNLGVNSNGEDFNYLSHATNNATTSPVTNRFLPTVCSGSVASIPHYNDDGTVGTPTTVQPGDPAIQRRFSLAKLAWLTHTGPSTTAFAGSLSNAQKSAAIQACFGLIWDTSANPNGDPAFVNDHRWDYVGPAATTIDTTKATIIETLAQVASENREPNFFELLQAGILQGSLGASGHDPLPDYAHGYSFGGVAMDEWNRTYQIFRIGLNLIDQATPDNYPTALECVGNDVTDISGVYALSTVELWGIKDLPYVNKLLPLNYWPNAPTGPGPVYSYIVFELWNPHQPSPTTVSGPTEFRIRPVTNAAYQVEYYPSGSDPNALFYFSTDAKNCPLYFTADGNNSDSQQSYRQPHLIRTPEAPSTSNTQLTAFDPKLAAIDLATDNPAYYPHTGSMYVNMCTLVRDGVFVVEYKDTDGTYRPYTTFVGRPDRSATGLGGSFGSAANMSATSYEWPESFNKADPRTFRFDTQWAGDDNFDTTFRPTNGTYYNCNFDRPNFMSPFYNQPGQVARLASNDSSVAYHFYPDPDGLVRWGDDYDNDQNPYNVTDSTARPVILNRPFRSVTEMGYAYRDVAFKTLDFFSNTSADGGLLDLFSVTDEPALTAGRLNLAALPTAVQQSLSATVVPSPAALAADYQAFTRTASATPTTNVVGNVAQLPNFIFSGTTTSLASVYVKTARETAVKALSGPVQTRTWNLFIDVVAQSGRFPTSSSTAASFMVEGEKHCWLSVAIDRYTGKIVDQQIEFINE